MRKGQVLGKVERFYNRRRYLGVSQMVTYLVCD